jgi:hypothetical protein
VSGTFGYVLVEDGEVVEGDEGVEFQVPLSFLLSFDG